MHYHLAAIPPFILGLAFILPSAGSAQVREEYRVIAWSRDENSVALRSQQDVFQESEDPDEEHLLFIDILIVSTADQRVMRTFHIDVSSPTTRRESWEAAQDWLRSEGYVFVAGANAQVFEHEFGPVGGGTLEHAIAMVAVGGVGERPSNQALRIPLSVDLFGADFTEPDLTAAHLELVWERVRGTEGSEYVYFERSERRVVPPGEEHNAQILKLLAWRDDGYTVPTVRPVASVAYVEQPIYPVHEQPFEYVAHHSGYACSHEYSPSLRWLILICYHPGVMASRFGDYQIISLDAVSDTVRSLR